MGAAKEMWMDAVEAEAMRLVEEEDMDEQEAWEQAEGRGDDLLADRMAELTDYAWQMKKEGRI